MQLLALSVILRFLTVLTARIQSAIFTIIICLPIPLAKPSPHVAQVAARLVTVHLLKEHFYPLFPMKVNSPTPFALFPRFSLQTVPLHRAPFAAQHLLLWMPVFPLRLPLQVSPAVLSPRVMISRQWLTFRVLRTSSATWTLRLQVHTRVSPQFRWT